MSSTRRSFLKTTSAATTAVCLPVNAWAHTLGKSSVYIPAMGRRGANDPDLGALAARAVDAAKAAGATYADVRLTLSRGQSFQGATPVIESEMHAMGVRVLVNGFWGFLASGLWTPDEAVRLAREAVAQAKAHGNGQTRETALAPVSPVVKGEWIMPVKYDPFDVSFGERMDFMNDAIDYASSYMVGLQATGSMRFDRQYKVFASSEGSSWAQTTYTTQGNFSVDYRDQMSLQLQGGGAGVNFLSPAGKGWEHISESGLIDAIPALIDQAEQSRHRIPVDPGRFDLVCSANAIAVFLDVTIGAATELDRALGFEANAGGTSYLNEPLEMLGAYKVGSSLLNVTGNRSLVGGAATVKWDDEAVEPDTFSLVRDGVLDDFQTTREQVEWLAPYYQKAGRTPRSHGCASAPGATSITMQHTPNLQVMPGRDDTSFEDLVAGTGKGIAVLGISGINMDQQQLNGVAYPQMRQITKGKLGSHIVGGGLLFRAPELWKGLVTIGGEKSVQWFGMTRAKGQPGQQTTHSVGGVAGKITNVGIVDVMRKA